MNWKKAMLAILGTLLIPYMVTLFLWDYRDALSQEQFYSGKSVILQESQETIDVEEYLVSVIAAQMPASWPVEAIKAQVILARTMIYQKMQEKHIIEEEMIGFDVYEIKEMEDVWGKKLFEEYYTKMRSAVCETAGQVVLWENKPVEALYHYASCGKTRADVTGYYPYFQTVESKWDLEASGYLQSIRMTREELIQKVRLLEGGEELGGEDILTSIQIGKKDMSGYVEQVLIEGKSFSGIQVANVLGIASCCFTIQNQNQEEFCITALGVGHGYGMSQWGAKSMAEEGKSATEILLYYYTGCEIREIA